MEYTEEQKENILLHYESIEEYEKEKIRREAQEYLDKTDYIVIKAYEYFMQGEELDKDYSDIFKKRESKRKILRSIKE